jgi:hypothetical protein
MQQSRLVTTDISIRQRRDARFFCSETETFATFLLLLFLAKSLLARKHCIFHHIMNAAAAAGSKHLLLVTDSCSAT